MSYKFSMNMDSFVARLTSLGFAKKGGCGRHSDGNVCEEYVAGVHHVDVFGLSSKDDGLSSKDDGLSSKPNEGFMAVYSHVNWMDRGCSELEGTRIKLQVKGDIARLSKSNYDRPEADVSATLEISKGVEAFFEELRVRLSS